MAGVAGPAADAVAALLPLHPLQGGHAAVTPDRPNNMVTLWYNYSHYMSQMLYAGQSVRPSVTFPSDF